MLRTLDTNICSYVLRRHPPEAIERLAALERDQLWISAMVASELRFGARKLGAPRFAAAVECWLCGFTLKPWSVEASHHYAAMRAALEQAGTPVGNMDLLIAAHAAAEDSVVLTNNAREFHRIPGVVVEAWTFG